MDNQHPHQDPGTEPKHEPKPRPEKGPREDFHTKHIKITDKQAEVVEKAQTAAGDAKIAVCEAYDVTVDLESKLGAAKSRLKRVHENAIEASLRYKNTLKTVAKNYGIHPEDASWRYNEPEREFVQS